MKNILTSQQIELRNKYLKILVRYKYKLNIQQFRVFKGQIKVGDYAGFIKGLKKVIKGSDKE